MSQMPPNQPPLPYGQPQYPAQPMPAYSMAPTQTNGIAIAALITGIVGFCVPIAGGLLAVIFGIIGIAKAKKTHSGAAMAIIGLILGLMSVAIYAIFGGAIWALVAGTKVNRTLASQFINDIAANNVAAAMKESDESVVKQEELDNMVKVVQGYGAITDITTFSFNVTNDEAELHGVVTFADGSKKGFDMRQKKVAGTWKVAYMKIQ